MDNLPYHLSGSETMEPAGHELEQLKPSTKKNPSSLKLFLSGIFDEKSNY
jgi:hypothetical protein